MKKDFIFIPIILIIAALLFLFDITGLPGHIAISVAGILVLVIYTVASKKDWKIRVLEIIMRVSYVITLISGIVIMNVNSIVGFGIVHKICAVIFFIIFIILFVHKVIIAKKNK